MNEVEKTQSRIREEDFSDEVFAEVDLTIYDEEEERL